MFTRLLLCRMHTRRCSVSIGGMYSYITPSHLSTVFSRPIPPEDVVEGCLLDYYYVECIHAGVQCLLAVGSTYNLGSYLVHYHYNSEYHQRSCALANCFRLVFDCHDVIKICGQLWSEEQPYMKFWASSPQIYRFQQAS